jgi:tetratricopeptide (TPR) repeat protein
LANLGPNTAAGANRGETWPTWPDVASANLRSAVVDVTLVLQASATALAANHCTRCRNDLATTWLKRFPGDWQAYLFRGRAYQWQGHLSQAMSDYQEALRVQPDALAAKLWYADTCWPLTTTARPSSRRSAALGWKE